MSKPLYRVRASDTTESGLRPSPHPMDVALWHEGQNVLFREGGPEKMPGWVRITAGSPPTLLTPPRGMNALQKDTLVQSLIFGNTTKVYKWEAATFTDISPSPAPTGVENESGSAFASTWTFCPYGNFWVMSNGKDGAWSHNGTSTTALSDFSTYLFAQSFVKLGSYLFALGTNAHPSDYAWSHKDSFSIWTPAAANSAGYDIIRDMDGPIIGGLNFQDRIAVIGKNSIFFVQFIGAPLYFRWVAGPKGIGISGKAAAVEANRMLFGYDREAGPWISDGQRFERIASPHIWRYITDLIDTSQLSKVVLTHDRANQQVNFFLPTAATGENTFGVAYDYGRNAWTILAFGRTAAVPQPGAFPVPYAAKLDGIYSHNTGVDDHTSAMDAWVRTRPLDLDAAQAWKYVDVFMLQLRRMAGTVSARMGFQEHLDDAVNWTSYQTCDNGFEPMFVRESGRFVTLEVRSNAVGGNFALSGFDIYGELNGLEF